MNLLTNEKKSRVDIDYLPLEKEMRLLFPTGLHIYQDTVYRRLSTALTQGEVQNKIIGDFGIPIAREIAGATHSNLGDAYLNLLLEPSISIRIDEFIRFVLSARSQGQESSPWDMRNKFKDSLGKKMVYRVSALNPEELGNILNEGFICNFYRNRSVEELLSFASDYETTGYSITNLLGRVNTHAGVYANTKDSTLISVSEYPDMATYAATVQLKSRLSQIKAGHAKLYLFPITIADFYLLRYGKYLRKTITAKGVWSDGKTTIPYGDPGVEELIEFHIPPQDIMKEQIKELDPNNIPIFRYIPTDKR